jgi:alpha-galactosidase
MTRRNVKSLFLTTIGVFLAAMAFCLTAVAADTVLLGSLDLSKAQQDQGRPQVNKSLGGKTLTIAGQTFEQGLGVSAASTLYIDLKGTAEKFTANVGVDDEVKAGSVLAPARPGARPPQPITEEQANAVSVVFSAYGDGREIWKSKIMKLGEAPEKVEVDLKGVKTLVLLVEHAGQGNRMDHADWADAKIAFTGQSPVVIAIPVEPAVILTPKPPETPRINGPKIFGVRPGSPFMFTIPATGNRPMTFAAENLPEGLQVDSQSGLIIGKLQKRGEYIVTLIAKNDLGENKRNLKIVCGDTIALTPPLGWNSWNCFGREITDTKVRIAADAMVDSGLINHGWTYINIDDCWEICEAPRSDRDQIRTGKPRDENGMINTNRLFPNMKALCDYVHGRGLKIGIYSSPGPRTCAGFTASYEHEEQDAQRYAEWGFDYLKYDWCSYRQIAPAPVSLSDAKKPYQVMRAALDKVNRDIVYSLCQYGMNDVWEWGTEVGGNCWRTTGDITDTWSNMSSIWSRQVGHEKFASPGHWNDPDMMVVGYVDVGRGRNLHPSRLTPNEQYTHVSAWCLLCSPLLIGCDMAQLDDFTIGLLTNDEVLEVSQDPLGKQAGRVSQAGNLEVWAKAMEDGSMAVGLFNRGEFENKVTVKWSDLGISGKQIVRDLWRQKDVGEFDAQYAETIGRHGAALIRLRPAGK